MKPWVSIILFGIKNNFWEYYDIFDEFLKGNKKENLGKMKWYFLEKSSQWMATIGLKENAERSAPKVSEDDATWQVKSG